MLAHTEAVLLIQQGLIKGYENTTITIQDLGRLLIR